MLVWVYWTVRWFHYGHLLCWEICCWLRSSCGELWYLLSFWNLATNNFFLGLTQTIAISFFWEVFNVWKPEGSGNSFHFRHYELQTKYFTKYLTKYSESYKTGLYWTDNPEIEPFNRKHRKFCRRSQIKLKFPVRKFWKFRGCSLRNSPRFLTAGNFAFLTWDRD